MKKLEWSTVQRKVNELIPFEQNPRKMTEEQVAQLTKSIEQFNLVELPAIDTDNILVAGHQRMKVMQLLGRGEETIDVRIPNRKLTAKEFKDYNVRSNKNTGMWDDELLAGLFDEQELRELGFNDLELGMLDFDDNKEETEDDVPEAPEEPVSKLGDIYELGFHRVMCGDSTKKEDVDKLMDGKQADMVFTDPPYNVNYEGEGKDTSNKIMNDSMSDSAFDEFLSEVFKRYDEHTKEEAGWYVFHSSSTQHQFQKAIEDAGAKVKCQIIWNKPNASMGWGDYRYKHEPMFYCGKESTNFYGDRTGTTVWDFHDNEDDLLKFVKNLMRAEREGKTTIWTMKREPVGGYVHPTQKPVELIEYAIRNSSKNGQLVMDLFLGSGATLIACGKKGRVCAGMELDPKYVDVIVSRYCEYVQNWEVTKNGEKIIWPKNEKKK
jgi:DNA modification methylase